LSGLKKIKRHVLVCKHKNCEKRGGRDALRSLKGALKAFDLRDEVLITKVDCFDLCDEGPVFVAYPEGIWYGGVDERAALDIAERLAGAEKQVRCNVLLDMRAGAPEGS
jgi:(2Fe-2S) ferredoxin